MLHIRVNGKLLEVQEGVKLIDILKNLGLKGIFMAEVDGEIVELSFSVTKDCEVRFLDFSHPASQKAFWHTASHIMAQAVKRIFPGVKLGIGPAIESGFYYDFDHSEGFSPEDLEKIEKEMERIVELDYPVIKEVKTKDEAKELLKDEPYKLELLEDIPNEKVSFYRQGEFVDLCAGPHLPSTGYVKHFKLLSVAGAYWKGNEKNPMLQRIYGTAFPEKEMLEDYLNRIEEAKRRDHRRLGRELELFSLHEEGPGFPFFHPKGMIILNELIDFWRKEHRRAGYREIRTPIILSRELWERSGHWDHYKENMYFTKIDEADYAIKPMNCPGAILVFKEGMRSYRDLPLRLAELGVVHRHERSGVLHGLMRVRAFTQDDAHIFCTPDQIKGEIEGIIKLADRFYRDIFGFEYSVVLSTKPEKAMGPDEIWEKATNALKATLEELSIPYDIREGEGAFYGPKIDFLLKDCIGRTWQCGTIQLDFLIPEKFDVTYVGPDGGRYRPVMLHRVIYGSLERFFGILIEHYAGAFPLWLAPVQVRVLTVGEAHIPFAKAVYDVLYQRDYRVELDDRNEKLGYKIRSAQLEKIPYMLIIGDKEVSERKVSVRERKEGDIGSYTLEEFLVMLEERKKSFK
ncbi:MAG: threonine--tRNA ligase [Synergistetes bacterium]|nr:threonine--tRNA ligase [Synergistota bacterium]MCX8127378.1 threonine--tRNA ligase [Synergistota bacterium]MDW8192242.1 threonine--tRNA ligase [Synergistota bacterium]